MAFLQEFIEFTVVLTMTDFLEYWSEDKKFGLRISQQNLDNLLQLCGSAGNHETGGLLVGFYNEVHSCAIVTGISKSPPDSRTGRIWFERGIRGLQQWLDTLWLQKQHFYLGEWHFHPQADPTVSQDDIEQMQQISQSKLYQCPEPVLLIIGGSPPKHWNAKGYVFPLNSPFIELTR